MENMQKDDFRKRYKELTGIVEEGPIVIVDDNEDIQFLFERMYESTKKTNPLIVLSSGNELLEHMDKVDAGDEVIPDIILLDINMPNISGFDALKEIRANEKFQAIPIVVMFTSSESMTDFEKAKEYGADGFISKPSKVDDYLKIIEAL